MIKRGNIGEKDEPIIIETLVSLRGKYVEPLGEVINSVANYRGEEYPEGIGRDLITKAPHNAKRDVLIDNKGYSLKSTAAAPPAIVNHTNRQKWIRVCRVVGTQIDELDGMVSEYWELRKKHRIPEDVHADNPLCPFVNGEERQRYLKSLVNYFLFDGTGSGDSPYPAEYILEFYDPEDPKSWKIFDRDSAFDYFWRKMVFSLRSKKGMPPKYPDIDLEIKRQIEPWVTYIDGDYRGALHIRLKELKGEDQSHARSARKSNG